MTLDLSVVVPVYNVEKYLRRCLVSLVDDLGCVDNKELILINDGSLDDSYSICEEFASKYKYIRVINQENQGLAEVRNRGIAEAEGEFISFIDSDDFIRKGLFNHALELLHKYSADIFCFKCLNVYEGKDNYDEITSIIPKNEKLKFFTKAEALDQIFFDNYIDVITCNKIIKKECFNSIVYPAGKYYEDMFTTYKVLKNASMIISSNLTFHAKTV